MTGVADDTERNDNGSRVEFKILAARKVDGAEVLGEAFSICLGLALCFSRKAGATAGCLDGRVRGRNGKGLQSEDCIFCGWGRGGLGHVPSGRFRPALTWDVLRFVSFDGGSLGDLNKLILCDALCVEFQSNE